MFRKPLTSSSDALGNRVHKRSIDLDLIGFPLFDEDMLAKLLTNCNASLTVHILSLL